MAEPSSQQITELLVDWSNGDQSALDKLLPLVYEELRRLARHYMRRERPGQTLQTTALVNEAYLRLVDYKKTQCHKRAHFFAIAAQVMRRILIERARARGRDKRGGGARRVPLDELMISSEDHRLELLALDEALTKLASIDPRKAQVVEMRFFGGLSNKEISEVLHISPNAVIRDWNFAEAWLRREMAEPSEE